MKTTTYEPLGNTVIVEAILPQTTLALPGNVDLQAERYKVIALGDGDLVSSSLGVDDIVILSSGAAMVSIKDTPYKITNAENVLAIVNEEEE